MNRPRILFIAPSSYPPINPEANVNAKVVKLLSEVGCTIDLVCRSVHRQLYKQNEDDDFFFRNVCSVHVVTTRPKLNFETIVNHTKTLLKTRFVYRGADWAYYAALTCDKLIKQHTYDFVYTYDAPSELVGLYVAKKYGIRWVATWNDPYIWDKYPAPYGKGYQHHSGWMRERLIQEISRYVYRNAFPSDRLRDYMLLYMKGMKRESCVILPHLASDELTHPNTKTLGETLKMIHSGALGKERDPKKLLEGLRMFLNRYPDVAIELSLLGVFERVKGNYVSDLIDHYDLGSHIRFIPPVSYAESLTVVRDFDLCLVVEANLEEGIFLPSKIADYLQNSKPIFAVTAQKGVLNDEYRNGVIDYFADVTSAESIASELERIYCDFKSGKLGIQAKDDSKYHNEAVIATHIKDIFQD